MTESTTNFEKHTNSNPISRFFLNNFSKTLISELRQLEPTSVLDVGAGEGFMLKLLKDNHIGKTLEGIEYMDEAIAIGKKLHPDIRIKKGDIYKLPYKDNSFDVVICTEVMEHLELPKKALTIGPATAITVVLAYFLIQMFEGQVLVPKIMQRAVGLNPIIVIIAIMIGANLMGLGGALLAIPFVSFIQVIYQSVTEIEE